MSALEKVQPEPLTGADITAQFGAPWVPEDVYVDFLKDIGVHDPKVVRVPVTGEWRVSTIGGSRDANSKFATNRVDIGKIINAALNNQQITVRDRISDTESRVNEPATTEARVKTEALKEAFTGDQEHGIDGWVWADPERAQRLEGIFNRTYNNLAARKYDGSHLTFPGLNPDFATRQHRRDSVWRMIQSGNTLLAHVVGSGKAQPLDAKILTRDGWKRMGDVVPGNIVIAGDGTPARVLGVYPQGEKDIYRVTFSDGGSTECCDEHLWATHTYRERGYAQRAKKIGRSWDCAAGKVRPLSEIRATIVADHLSAKNHSIPVVGAVQFRSRPIPLDPYLVGVLIGDGCLTMRHVMFSTADNEILTAVSDAIPEDCELVHRGRYDYAIAFRGKVARAVGERGSVPSHPVKNALVDLGLMGCYSYQKRIPEVYLHNDIETRISILRGLMDTDGTVDKRGVSVTFTTVSAPLADDVTELVRSLGGLVTRSVRMPPGGNHLAITLQVAMPPHINPFRLPRKSERVRPKSKYAPDRYITGVTLVGRKEAQCIMIDHPSHLYVTDDFIVTHNTVTMIAGAMEQKRLGLINKPAFVVPNHMLEQFSREFIQAYPDAKIIVAQKDEMTRENRREFMAKISANDWDGVIITHDAFGRINMSEDFRRAFIREQLDELTRVMKAEAAGGGKNSPTIKNLERAKKKLEGRLDALMNEERKDVGTSFEESGIDHLSIDEAHKFKNLAFVTRLQRVKGLAQGDSQRAEDLFLKLRYLEQKRPGRSAVFATGTPVSNTMAELWTMQRYLQLDRLKERGLDTFDAWASTFGRVVNNMELSADGRTFKEVSSFSKFVNVPELISLYSEVADTKTADMLNLPRPDVKTRSGAPGIEIVEATPSAQEEEHIEKLVKLAESLKGKRPEPGQPNMLSVVTAGRKVATDGRLISPDFDFNPQGKIAKAVDNIARIYREGNKDPEAPNKVQMVFLDMGVPQTRAAAKPKRKGEDTEESTGAPEQTARIDLYADIKKRLVEQGIPAREIAAIHDATDDAKKAKLFARVRSGDVRVILGSSEKMGVGTNVQDRLIAMHHLDAPWKPAEVEQRDGRIVRQGNKNPNVQIYRYVTKKSFDAFMWQKLDTKSKFIGQVLSGAKGSRHAEDIDNPLPEAAEMKAAASGDPRIMEHAELDRQVRALSAQRRSFEATKSRAHGELGSAESRIKQYEAALPNAREDAAQVTDVSGDKFVAQLGGVDVTDRKEAGQAILQRLLALEPGNLYAPKVVNVGRLSGFDMNLEVRKAWDGVGSVLRAEISLKGKSGYASPNDTVINEHTDPAGLIRRFENLLGRIKDNPARLDRELANEKDSVGKLKKTLTQTWPREAAYRESLKKLDDLSKSMKAPEHPDVTEVKAQRARGPEVAWSAPGGQVEEVWHGSRDPLSAKIAGGARHLFFSRERDMAEGYAKERAGKKGAPLVTKAWLDTSNFMPADEYLELLEETKPDWNEYHTSEAATLDDPGLRNAVASRGYSGVKDLWDFGFHSDFDERKVLAAVDPSVVVHLVPPDGVQSQKAEPFYSQVARTIEGAKQAKATPEQWLGMLKNAPGVKSEEMEWLGLADWLKEQKGPVTKQAISDYVRANQIEVKEVEKGGPLTATADEQAALYSALDKLERAGDLGDPNAEIQGSADDLMNGALDGDAAAIGDIEGLGIDDRLIAPFRDRGRAPTKFGQYTLPGGENYRELLLTLPEKEGAPSASGRWQERQEPDGSWMPYTTDTNEPFATGTYHHDRAWAEAAARYLNREPPPPSFRSSHWDEPNVLAHVRFDDRTIDGKKTLHLAEVQSDMHQQGRKKGYAGAPEVAVKRALTAEEARRVGLPAGTEQYVIERNGQIIGSGDTAEEARLYANTATPGVPNAPFKTTWPELALKRMIRYAAENGYDQLSWDTGATNAERYDLSKKISEVRWNETTGDFQAKDLSGNVVLRQSAKAEELPDIIGKEAADKLVNQKPEDVKKLPLTTRDNLTVAETEHQYIVTNVDGREVKVGKGVVGSEDEAREYAERHLNARAKEINENRELSGKRVGLNRVLSGLDLKVGGEGMHSFYDRELVNVANKLGKKFGAKVGRGEIERVGAPGEWKYRGPTNLTPAQIRDAAKTSEYGTAQIETQLRQIADRVASGTPIDVAMETFGSHNAAKAIGGELIENNKGVHTLPITPELRDVATNQGFPLFRQERTAGRGAPASGDPIRPHRPQYRSSRQAV